METDKCKGLRCLTDLTLFSCVCSVCAYFGLSVSSSSWGLGRAAVCDCGTPWTFLLPFFFFYTKRNYFYYIKHKTINHFLVMNIIITYFFYFNLFKTLSLFVFSFPSLLLLGQSQLLAYIYFLMIKNKYKTQKFHQFLHKETFYYYYYYYFTPEFIEKKKETKKNNNKKQTKQQTNNKKQSYIYDC